MRDKMQLRDDLIIQLKSIISDDLNQTNATVIPSTEGVELSGGSKTLDATFLYADLAESSYIVKNFDWKISVRIIKAYLACMCKLIRFYKGNIVSFDGDRVMGVFIGDNKNSRATLCALKMGYVLSSLINPRFTNYFKRIKKPYKICHCVGIDTSNVTAVKAGIRGSNDLVWIGAAPNFAAKLSEQRFGNFNTYISESVYNCLNESLTYLDKSMKLSDLYFRDKSFGLFGLLEPLMNNSQPDPVIIPDYWGLLTNNIIKKNIWEIFHLDESDKTPHIYRSNYHYII